MRPFRLIAVIAAFACLAACSDLGPTGVELADECTETALVQCGYIGSNT